MQIKRLAALSLAAIVTAAMLTGCDLLAWLAWLEENSDSSSVTSSPSSSTSRPSYDDENDDDASSPPPAEPEKPEPNPNDHTTWIIKDGTLIVPEDTTTIPANAFANNEDITSLDLTDSDVTSIGESAFEGCTNLTSIELPDSLTSIGTAAFQGTSLISIRVGTGIIGDGMTIGVNAFDGVPNTVMVYYPKEWDADADKDDKLKAVQAKLASGGLQTNLSNYQPGNGEYTQPTQASPAVPDSAKKLLDAVRAFGM